MKLLICLRSWPPEIGGSDAGTGSRLFTSGGSKAPPHLWFCVSAVFHYLGPAFAVLLFPSVGVLGVAWLRIATAAAFFAPVTRPWRTFGGADTQTRLLLIAFGACLALMNCAFYLALERLPLSLVAAIEFVGTIVLAVIGPAQRPQSLCAGARGRRHLLPDRRQVVERSGRACAGRCSTA